MDCIQGIWFEENRNRWRVKLFKDGKLYHRSYHKDYKEAFSEWSIIKQEIAQPRQKLSETELSPIARFLRQPVL